MSKDVELNTIAQIVAWMKDDEEADHAALICFEEDGHINLHVLADLIFKAHNNELFELRNELDRVKCELEKTKRELEEMYDRNERFLAALSDPDIH